MGRHSELNNRSQQLNPNNDVFWQSRGFDERPENWEERAEEESPKQQAEAKDTKQHS